MSCKVEKSKLNGNLACPSNKSYTHRAIFLASLAEGKSTIKNVLISRDTVATMEVCRSFGAKIEENERNLTITGVGKNINAFNIDASNSGTTIRIAAAIASLSSQESTLTGDESLKKRPMKPLLDALESIGVTCTSTNGTPPIIITGKTNGGDVSIAGNISSQFISALFIVAPLTQKGITITIQGDLVSKPYLDATIATMKKFGVDITTNIPYQKYIIEPQVYKSTTFVIPSDFSSLALLLSASILVGEKITIELTESDLPQGDIAIIDILKKLGADITLDKNNISVSSKQLEGGKFDLGNTPDLLPALAILSLKSSNSIEINNVKHARYKETDRIAILANELQKLGINLEEKEDGLVLKGIGSLNGCELNSHDDHRLFMAFCISAMLIGNCTVSNPSSIDVSYPNFISDMTKLGGKISILK